MTREEAIKVFESELEWAELNMYPYISEQKVKADKMAIKAIEQTTWVPCSERLPESDGYYLVTEKSSRVCKYVFHKEGNSEEYWKRCVVAWMPLPKPYKAESEE